MNALRVTPKPNFPGKLAFLRSSQSASQTADAQVVGFRGLQLFLRPETVVQAVFTAISREAQMNWNFGDNVLGYLLGGSTYVSTFLAFQLHLQPSVNSLPVRRDMNEHLWTDVPSVEDDTLLRNIPKILSLEDRASSLHAAILYPSGHHNMMGAEFEVPASSEDKSINDEGRIRIRAAPDGHADGWSRHEIQVSTAQKREIYDPASGESWRTDLPAIRQKIERLVDALSTWKTKRRNTPPCAVVLGISRTSTAVRSAGTVYDAEGGRTSAFISIRSLHTAFRTWWSWPSLPFRTSGSALAVTPPDKVLLKLNIHIRTFTSRIRPDGESNNKPTFQLSPTTTYRVPLAVDGPGPVAIADGYANDLETAVMFEPGRGLAPKLMKDLIGNYNRKNGDRSQYETRCLILELLEADNKMRDLLGGPGLIESGLAPQTQGVYDVLSSARSVPLSTSQEFDSLLRQATQARHTWEKEQNATGEIMCILVADRRRPATEQAAQKPVNRRSELSFIEAVGVSSAQESTDGEQGLTESRKQANPSLLRDLALANPGGILKCGQNEVGLMMILSLLWCC